MPHAAGADAAEGQLFLRDVQDGVVDRHAAGHGLVEHAVAWSAVIAEVVQRQRTRMLIDMGDGRVEVRVGQHRQQRAENLVLHHAHAVIDIQQCQRRQLARVASAGAVDSGSIVAPRSCASAR
jgi:hypothetical protein